MWILEINFIINMNFDSSCLCFFITDINFDSSCLCFLNEVLESFMNIPVWSIVVHILMNNQKLNSFP